MAEFFDGKSARAQQVRVLLLNKQINIYHEEELISSTPAEACTVQKIAGKLYVYLTADATAFVTLEEDAPAARLIEDEIQSGKKDIFSRLMRIRLPVLLGVIAGIGLAIFLLFTWVIPTMGMRLVSVETEQKLGNSAYNSIIATETIDSAKTEEARAFADRLQLSDKYKLRIVVIKEKLVNAFALPGGTIVITTGIIKHMNSPEELAALLGHEVTHVNNRHSLRSMLKNMSVSAATSLVFGNSSSIINGAAYLNQLSYSRGLEAEADKTGIELLRRNHVNPIGMVKLMEDLQAQEKIQPVGFLSTHPLTKERIKAAKKVIQQLPAADYPPREDLEQIWKQLKQ